MAYRNTDTDVKRFAMIKHAHNILTDAICDLHCANELGGSVGVKISDSVFDHLDKQAEDMRLEMVELGSKTGLM